MVSKIESNMPFCACVCPYAYGYELMVMDACSVSRFEQHKSYIYTASFTEQFPKLHSESNRNSSYCISTFWMKSLKTKKPEL